MLRKKRSKPRPGRLRGKDLQLLRLECWIRDNGKCRNCGRITYFDAPMIQGASFHMAHIKAKRMGGDSLANVRTLCGACHRKEHSFGKSMTKPVPRKEKEA